MREVFPSENHSGYSSSLLETSLKHLTTPLCMVPARFHQKLLILSGPGALQLRFLDRTLTTSATSRARSLPVGGGTCSWRAIFTSCNPAAFLFPVPLSYYSFIQKPSCLFNVFKHFRIISSTSSRIFISCSLILWVPLQHPTQIRKPSSRDRVKLLVNYTRDLLFLFPVKPTF